ncbi:hypothetical protein D9M70_526180 [compost metagenome]
MSCTAGGRARKAKALDHDAGLGPPQPGAVGDDRMRHGQAERTAGKRQVVGDKQAPKPGQEPVRLGRGARFIHEPGEGRRQIHGEEDSAGAHSGKGLACKVAPKGARGYDRGSPGSVLHLS